MLGERAKKKVDVDRFVRNGKATRSDFANFEVLSHKWRQNKMWLVERISCGVANFVNSRDRSSA